MATRIPAIGNCVERMTHGGHKLSFGKRIQRTRSISGKLSTPRIGVGNMPHSWR